MESNKHSLQELKQDIDEYNYWVGMEWHLCTANQDDIAPIISVSDDLHHDIKKIVIENIPAGEIE